MDQWIFWGLGAFLLSFGISLALVTLILVKMPAAYFVERSRRRLWVDAHPAVRISLRIGKNLLGIGVIVAGIVLSLPGIPGQGVLTILIGLMLVDFPGKRRFELWLIRRPRIGRTINRVRRRFGAEPLQIPQDP